MAKMSSSYLRKVFKTIMPVTPRFARRFNNNRQGGLLRRPPWLLMPQAYVPHCRFLVWSAISATTPHAKVPPGRALVRVACPRLPSSLSTVSNWGGLRPPLAPLQEAAGITCRRRSAAC